MNLKELLYPPRCPFCGKLQETELPCKPCMDTAEELTGEVCRSCGAHPECCCCHGTPNIFERNISCYYYKGAPRRVLLRFKLYYRPQLAPFIARRMASHIRGRYTQKFTALCYVPNSPLSFLKRGYWPTRLLGRELARQLNLPLVNGLKRVGFKQQKYLTAAQRQVNARKSYRLHRGITLSGPVLLIDDLTTTGATLNACADLLKKGGAEQVYTATYAITQKKS